MVELHKLIQEKEEKIALLERQLEKQKEMNGKVYQ